MKKDRPEVLGGITVKVLTGCGNMYIQMNWCDGELFEVFATHGGAGGCATGQSEAITRSVTLGLRSGVPYEEYVKQLAGIRCPQPMPFPKDKAVSSCADAISKSIRKYANLEASDVVLLITTGRLTTEEQEQAAKARLEELAMARREQDL